MSVICNSGNMQPTILIHFNDSNSHTILCPTGRCNVNINFI